jgi:hypothetical protein
VNTIECRLIDAARSVSHRKDFFENVIAQEMLEFYIALYRGFYEVPSL